MKKLKYKNYKELVAAFKSGELDNDSYFLVLDKGGTCTYLDYDNPTLSKKDNEEMRENCCELFDGSDTQIEDVFEAAGIPCQWC